MLIDDPERDRKVPMAGSVVDPEEQENPNGAGPSASPPPAFASLSPRGEQPTSNDGSRVEFEDSNIFVPPGGEGPPPPDFTPYVADYFEAGDGSVVSHDPHLNEDGEWSKLYSGN